MNVSGTFMDKARGWLLTNAGSRFLFDHSEKISSYLFTGGNITLAAKNGIEPTAEGAAGLLYIASSMALRLSKKNPDLAFRLCGSCVIAGSLMLSASGYDFDKGQIADGWKMAAPLYGYVPTALMLVFQDKIAKFSEKYKESDRSLLRKFANACSFPVAASAAIDSSGSLGLAKSAVNGADPTMLAISVSWILGTLGLAASDPRLQELYEQEKKSTLPSAATSCPSPHM